ncbi:DUF6233 domain-containing protein [Streptomyces aureocirculatus]|uniref:DUF6233 domain-containing protein n=1 Tax=Streptomyces aureocirculatus TaxID=67275 RepID=UPI001CEC2F5D|nr:DUF6233 domain-containing protein [Streptomyces aureocirculatus]
MCDPASESPRLSALRFLERVQERDLARSRRWIADEERRATERARGRARRPRAPDWLIEGAAGRPPIYVHVGDCPTAGKHRRAASRDEARRALAGGVEACPHCRPDTELGVLD